MLFNSTAFIFLFLPVSVAVYFALTKSRFILASRAWLVLCSLFFYSYWNIRYLPLISFSILFNYAVGTALVKPANTHSSRRTILYFGVVSNLALLGYYKYFIFLIANVGFVTGLEFQAPAVTLPLGISFFTFTQIAYLVDCYRRESKEYDFLNYTLFVTFFPHLIAGPILHHKDLIPQFDEARKKVLNFRYTASGLYVFSIGLFKKVILADAFAAWANPGFDSPSGLSLIPAWITSLAYTFQLYFDFSGYIDMALGAALFFNIELPINFYSPYKARNIQDFWRRWHITLSKFLRSYLYIPLGGNRRGEVRTCIHLFLTFLLGGLWHGASWTFVMWGALHGGTMVLHRLWRFLNFRMNRLLAWGMTFAFVNASWVLFRAKDTGDALRIFRGMAGLNGLGFSDVTNLKRKIAALGAAFMIVMLAKNTAQLRAQFAPNWRTAVFCLLLAIAGLMNLSRVSEFIYFNF